MRGVIKQLPSDDTKDPKVGFLEYEKDGVRSEVSFAMSDVNEYITSLSVGDQVCTPTRHYSPLCAPPDLCIKAMSLHGCLALFLRALEGSVTN